MLKEIAANSLGALIVVFHVPTNVPTEQFKNIICAISSPFAAAPVGGTIPVKTNSLVINGVKNSNSDSGAEPCGGPEDCVDAILERGVEKTAEKLLHTDHDILGYRSCFVGATALIYDKFKTSTSEGDFIDQTATFYASATTGYSCARAAINTAGIGALVFGQVEFAIPDNNLSISE